MSRRALVLGLAVLLIVSTLLVVGTGGSQARSAPVPAPGPQAAPHPSVNSISLETFESNDVYYNTSYFYSGSYYETGGNTLYFAIHDSAGDSLVNFTIMDPNATRDGVSAPAFTATVAVNHTTGWYYSYKAGVSFTFPASLAIGGWWVVNASAPAGGSAQYNISVSTFYTEVSGNPYPYSGVLPGESVTVAWELFNDVNGAPATHVTNLTLWGWYFTNSTYENLFASGSVQVPVTPFGSYTFTIPDNATANEYLYLVVSPTIFSNGITAENQSREIWYGVGHVAAYVYQENEANTPCPRGYYDDVSVGEVVSVCIETGASFDDGFWAVPNLPISIHFWNGLSDVTPGGNPPTSLTSNATGFAAFTYIPTTPPLTQAYTYPYENRLNVSVTDPAATPVGPSWNWTTNNSLYVYGASQTGVVQVQLNQLEYYPGQPVTAMWSVGSSSSAATGTITAEGWYAYDESTDAFLSQGVISSTATSGSFTVTFPAGYTGAFAVYVYAVNATTSFEAYAYGYVTAPRLFLNPSSTTFSPGSTVTITAVAYGANSLSGAVITYEVYADYDLGENYGEYGLVGTGTVANDSSFTIDVPSTAAPGYYYVYAYLGSPASGTVATAETELSQAWGYYVTLSITTASSYSDGSYQPGETLTVAYQITPFGNAPLPVLYTFEVYLEGTPQDQMVSTSSTSGTVQITIPSGQPSGTLYLDLEMTGTYLYGNSCDGGYCYGYTSFLVTANPSVLNMLVGGSGGVTVGWLILLIIILVVAVVLVLLIRRKRASPPPPGGASTTTPMSPPAPAPTGQGAQEWSEPSPASQQPPMPTPPPGST